MMEYSAQLRNKKITIMGLGLNRGGLGVAKFLAQSGSEVLVTDLKSEDALQQSLKELEPYPIQFVLGKHRIQDFIDRDMVIQNPAVPNDSKYLQIARENNIPIETDLSLFLRICPSRNLIAVGGTKGKSTVTSLIYHIIFHSGRKIVYAGNIGVSVFDVLQDITSETIVLLEISSWQLEGLRHISFKPHIAVLTNILPDHLDRYRSFKDYIRVKQFIYQNQDQSDYLITNLDNPITKKIKGTNRNIYWFSTHKMVPQGSYLKQNDLIFRCKKNSTVFLIKNEIILPGIHNIGNTLAAANACFVLGLSLESIQSGIKTFQGIPNRLEKIKSFREINFYNDTCATTPDATIAAIQSFPNDQMILILGGRDKQLNYRHLSQVISLSKNIVHLIILKHKEYNASDLLLKELEKFDLKYKIQISNSMEDAVLAAYRKATPGTNILLSPSATSFGMFQNEFERGKSFSQAVLKITKK
ncbi:MAG: UDP-N-acetylmuramoyl-L-alanine--D-glutamate ligase [Candidatus Atribacteria bacterium]|nr:UDP-N-acetylmuramoyl-L-alanine--D-glutamate ligase [Candidatus Atribacteria bacterium]